MEANEPQRLPDLEDPAGSGDLGRIRARRNDLRQAMEYLEFTVAGASTVERWGDQVEAALYRLKDALHSHIDATEGPGGLLASIAETAPRLAAELGELGAEHQDLTAALERAFRSLAEPIDPRLVRRRVVALLGRLALHRQRGADLVYEAYHVDIGAGD